MPNVKVVLFLNFIYIGDVLLAKKPAAVSKTAFILARSEEQRQLNSMLEKM
jgi:hypothetical protein